MQDLTELACWAKKDPDAFAELSRRFHPLMASIAKKYWLPNDTEDETMQILRIELWNAVKKFRPERSFEGFVKMFLRNRMKTVITRKAFGEENRFWQSVDRLTWAPDRIHHQAYPSPEDEVVHKLATASLRKGLCQALQQALTDLERQCFIGRYIYGHSYRQIQDRLKLKSTKAVDNALTRVRKKLAKHPKVIELWKNLAR